MPAEHEEPTQYLRADDISGHLLEVGTNGGHVDSDAVGQVGQADRPAHVVDAQRLQEPPVVPGQSQPVDPVQGEAVQTTSGVISGSSVTTA
jgi:hypothetical protein